jgi:prepilin-type N-terminal cleavage/methylation domain-containing protein
MKLWRNFSLKKQRGFTLLEMMVSLLILTLVVGAVFSQMDQAQQRMASDQIKLDDSQQARDFVDQFFSDISQIGDPNTRMFAPNILPPFAVPLAPPYQAPLFNDNRLAVGLVKIDNTAIEFEGSVNGIGTVQSIQYMINGNGACALCLQRSQVDKANGNPWGQGANWGTEVNDVLSNPIFQYYDTNGNQIPQGNLPIDISTLAGAQTIATVKTVKISLRIQNPNIRDLKTNVPIEAVFEGEVSINNCSIAVTGLPMSCK